MIQMLTRLLLFSGMLFLGSTHLLGCLDVKNNPDDDVLAFPFSPLSWATLVGLLALLHCSKRVVGLTQLESELSKKSKRIFTVAIVLFVVIAAWSANSAIMQGGSDGGTGAIVLLVVTFVAIYILALALLFVEVAWTSSALLNGLPAKAVLLSASIAVGLSSVLYWPTSTERRLEIKREHELERWKLEQAEQERERRIQPDSTAP